MGWLNSAWKVFKKFGPTVRFASKLILNAVLPGSPLVVDLVCDGLAWAEKQADKMEKADRARPLAQPHASAAEQERLEQIRNTLPTDLSGLTAQAHVAAAARDLSALAEAQPASASAQAALACAQAANHDLGAAQRSLTRAVDLSPYDAELAELRRQVTRASTVGQGDTARGPAT